MENKNWDLEKLMNEVYEAREELWLHIHSKIEDEIFTRCQKLYLEKIEEPHLKNDIIYDIDILFGFTKNDRINEEALILLNAMNVSKDLGYFLATIDEDGLSCTQPSIGVAYMTTNNLDIIKEEVDIVPPHYNLDIFFLSLNKHLTIEQAHTLISKVSTRETKPRDEFDIFNLVTLLNMYAKFYEQKKTHSKFYELLTSELDRTLLLYKEQRKKPIAKKILTEW